MTFTEFLKTIPALNLALSGASAGLTKTVLQQRLIPDNLDWLPSAGVLVSIVAFLCVFGRMIPKAARLPLVLLGAISVAVLITMQIRLVERFDFYGIPFHELRGWSLSPEGQVMKHNLEAAVGQSLPIHDVIRFSDHTNMVALFGANFYASAALYSASFLALLFCVIAVAGRYELDAKHQ